MSLLEPSRTRTPQLWEIVPHDPGYVPLKFQVPTRSIPRVRTMHFASPARNFSSVVARTPAGPPAGSEVLGHVFQGGRACPKRSQPMGQLGIGALNTHGVSEMLVSAVVLLFGLVSPCLGCQSHRPWCPTPLPLVSSNSVSTPWAMGRPYGSTRSSPRDPDRPETGKNIEIGFWFFWLTFLACGCLALGPK